jgi:hypothetical protein
MEGEMLITKQNINISFLILPSFIRHVKYEGRISRNSVQTVEEVSILPNYINILTYLWGH